MDESQSKPFFQKNKNFNESVNTKDRKCSKPIVILIHREINNAIDTNRR